MRMIKHWEWVLLAVLAAVGVGSWLHWSLPRYKVIDLSVTRPEAENTAKAFLKTKEHVDPASYRMAEVFDADDDANRFLQKALGIQQSQALIKKLHYDLFFWQVRFFKEQQKEEFKVIISAKTGQVIGFNHVIADTAARPSVDLDTARQEAFSFLQQQFGFQKQDYLAHAENVTKHENRSDYSFTWETKGVGIPWKDGQAKLLSNVVVSGHSIMAFNKNQFDVPDAFNRYVENLKQTGESLTLVFRLLYLALLTIAIVVMVNRKHYMALRAVKSFYVVCGIVLFVFLAAEVFNNWQDLLSSYPTTQSFWDYMVRQIIQSLIVPFFIVLAFVLPALAGEALHYEVDAGHKNRSLLGFILSSFRSVSAGQQICAGYLIGAAALGFQAVIYSLGYKYCGVWEELSWLNMSSAALLPAWTALTIGTQAAFAEELMFRLFAINLFRKYRVPVFFALFFSAVIWAFGHTGYEIFPMWFRGVEVTCVGLLLGWAYLRFGLLTTLAAHFLMDAFLILLPYLLKPKLSFNLYMAGIVLALPLAWAIVAFIMRRSTQERPLALRFNAQQKFNCHLLEEARQGKTLEQLGTLKADLLRHGWDPAVVQRAFEEKEPC